MLTILGEHYNNVKVLDVLNQELFQLWMAAHVHLTQLEEEDADDGKDKETVLDWGICLIYKY